MKKSYWGLLIIIFFFTLITILLEKCGENRQKNVDYMGILINIFIDERNRSQYTYEIQTEQGIIYQQVTPYKDSFDYIEKGDSIIKEKGKSYITIKKKKSNYNISATFYYNN